MPLESLPDLFDAATHRKLDKKVEKAVEDVLADVPDLSPNFSWHHGTLLSAIIEHSNGNLDTKYLGVEQTRLIRTNGELRDMLASAWKQKSYREIRNLAILHPSPGFSSRPMQEPEVLTGTTQERLMSALTHPYQGVAVDALYEYLERNNQNFSDPSRPGYYARSCSIVQSSGTGKTRTIIELARKGVLVLYMNLRPTTDKSGFPLRDDIPASILTGKGGSESLYHVQCCAFFAAIFKLVSEDLATRLARDGEAAVGKWNDIMCQLMSPHRADFFTRLKSTYSEIKRNILLKVGIDDTMDATQALSLSLKNTGSTSGRQNSAYGVAEKEMENYYTRMTDLFSTVFLDGRDDKPKVVIALDEAHSLQELQDFRRETVLLRVIKAYSAFSPLSYAVWVVFASTTLKVAHFASPQALFNSARVSILGELLFPPFSEMGWDHYAPPLGTVPSSEVAKAKHILRYGRPLWASLQGAFGLEQIFHLATQKLSGAPPYDGTNSHRALAVLAQRFGLEVRFGHRDAVNYVESSVASHLRVCITTTEDRLWSYTTYPSEPFLSCAAAFSLHRSANALESTLKTFQKKVDDGMIDIGQRGELASRLLWLLAKDLFVLRNNTCFARGNGLEAELVHCQMISVTTFFEFLFGDAFWSQGVAGPDAKATFKDAYVNFSHWVSMDADIRQEESNKKKPDQTGMDEWTLRHWQRTSAVQCFRKQPLIDKVIPIYFKPADGGNNDLDCMSQIFISDKARVAKQSGALQGIRRAAASIGGPDHSSNRPYIVILADLGLDKVGLDPVTFSTRSSKRLARDTTSLRIHACGFSPKTYPFLQDYPVVLNTLQHLIRKQKLPRSERPLAEFLRDQVRYGSSAEVRHMNWERGSSATVETVLR